MSGPLSILVLEDSLDDTLLMIHEVKQAGFEPVWQRVDSEADYLRHLHPGYDIILCDYFMPQFSAPRALELLHLHALDIPLIVITGTMSEDIAVDCIQQGAADYLLKDRLARLGAAVTRALNERRLRQEKQHMAAMLQERESRYRLLAENAPDIIFRYRLLAEPGFEYVSPALRPIIGYTPEEYYADPHLWQKTIYPDDRPLTRLERLNGQKTTFELRLVRKDGQMIWAELKLVPIHNDHGALAAVEGICRDITAHRQMAATLQTEQAMLEQRVEERAQTLRALNAELARVARGKDEFLANMSHELRTPLSAILGLTETLQEEVFGPLNDRQRQYLIGVEESGRHLLALINDVLDVAKVQHGSLQLECSAVLVEGVCLASLRLIRQVARKKGIELFHAIDHSVITMWADERRMKQILVNLLSNAVKFTPEGGTVGLEVAGDSERQRVLFTVWDTGIGIAHEDVGYLFKPFLQLDSSLSREFDGTGLGLALVFRMTELHGGGISVESEPGKGSRFVVSLPWNELSSRAAEASGTPDQAAGVTGSDQTAAHHCSSRVLLVEDNEQNIIMFRDYLQSQGCQVSVAHSGSEALEHLMSEIPDVILMDIQMPGMNGYDTIRCIRADLALPSIPIIALTALVMPGDRERCLQAGADAYLSKPVRLSHLLQLVQEHSRHAPCTPPLESLENLENPDVSERVDCDVLPDAGEK